MVTDIHKTNVPNIRMKYRYDTLMQELEMIVKYSKNKKPTTLHDDNIVTDTIGDKPLLYENNSTPSTPGGSNKSLISEIYDQNHS